MKTRAKEAMMMISSSSILTCILCVLIILLPFNAVINTFFSEKLGIEAFKFWKEGIFLIVFLIGLVNGAYKKIKLNALLVFSLAYIAMISLYSLVVGINLDFVRILRLELLPIIAILIFSYTISGLDTKNKETVLNYLLYGSLFGILIGGLFFAMFGGEGLVMFGYRMDWSTFYSGEALAFCQRIENSEVCRFQGFLSGPNQMGIYLVLIGAVCIKKFQKRKIWTITGLGLIGALIITTFSRSALLAYAALIGLYGLIEYKDFLIKNHQKLIGVGIISVIGIGALFSDQIYDLFSRPESTSEHFRLMAEGLTFWKENFIFGNGAGSVGPSSRFVSETVLIPENWFLQVAGQFGLVGLVLFVSWYLCLSKKLWDNKSYAGFALIVSILIPLNLLHSFESASFVYALAIFISLELDEVQNRV